MDKGDQLKLLLEKMPDDWKSTNELRIICINNHITNNYRTVKGLLNILEKLDFVKSKPGKVKHVPATLWIKR